MYLPPTSTIRVEAASHEVSYFLPARPIGKVRWFGLIPIAFSLLFISIPAKSLIEFLQHIQGGKGDIGNWFFILFLSGFVVTGLTPMCLGLLAICGRCRVDWREGRLTITDYFGPIRWRRRLPRGPIHRFLINAGGVKVNDKPATSGPLADLGALVVEFDQGKPRLVVIGYPRDWLAGLAQDLSARVGVSVATVAAQEVKVVDSPANQPEVADVTEKPNDSQVRSEPRTNGLLLVVPPVGLRQGGKGLFGFGILWCLFMVVFTGAIMFGKGKGGHGPPWFIWIFVGVFWLIGLSMLTGAINMGRRRAMLLIEDGELRVAQESLFGAKRWAWRREEIAAVRADASGMAVNNVPVIDLQIHLASGKTFGFFAGRDDQELRWMATELRRVLNVPAKTK
ncbi:MAG: hypothetical protein HY298_07590 [Verrucomicrobia bacterium]|nr:hypothetical protein [Verrucomicrobiota bacterium]